MEVNQYTAMMFWSKVEKTAEDACWEWKGTIHKKHYPKFIVSSGGIRESIPAHRFVYMLAHGVSSDQVPWYDVVYTCGNKRCMNPKHLNFINERPDRARASQDQEKAT